MSIKYVQPTISTILEYVDNQLWSKVAVKKLDKIKKPLVRNEAHKVLRDFQLMQGSNTQSYGTSIRQEMDCNRKLYDRNITGNAKVLRQDLSKSTMNQSKLAKRNSSKITNRRSKRHNTKVYTEGPDTINYSTISQLDNSVHPLFISESTNPEEEIKDNHLRMAQQEKLKFYQKEEQLEKTRHVIGQERSSQQRKRLGQAKKITYDYEGRIMPLPATEKGGKIRVFTVDSYFSHSMVKTKSRGGPTGKITTIQNKRVIASRSKTQESEDDAGIRFAKTVPLKNVIELFKDSMQMGVSFTDLGQQSTIHGRNRNQSVHNKMKLSDFKANKSSFKPRMYSEGSEFMRPIFRKKKIDLDNQSDALSKSLASSLCQQSKSFGRISKNVPVYSQVFDELE